MEPKLKALHAALLQLRGQVTADALEKWSPMGAPTAIGDMDEVAIYGPIVDEGTRAIFADWFDDHTMVSGESFRKDLDGKGDILVRLNSPGGAVWEASVIHGALGEHLAAGNAVHALVDGIAASATTMVMLVAETIQAQPMASLMIHYGHGIAAGTTKEITSYAKYMADYDKLVLGLYAKRMKGDETAVHALLDAETWFTPDSAIDAGLVDEVREYKAAGKAKKDMELSAFQRTQDARMAAMFQLVT